MKRRATLILSMAAVLAGATASVSVTPAGAYGKASWQTALNGTVTFPSTGFGFGFWGWCDFAGSVNQGDTAGTSADCQIAEYFHNPPPGFGPAFNCELSIDATAWDESGLTIDGSRPAFAVTGTATVRPANLTDAQKRACVSFFTGDPSGSTTFSDVDTFIPAAPGHFSYPPGFPESVGELQFQVTHIPSH